MLFYVYERYGLETGRWCLGPYGRLHCSLETRPSASDSAALNTASGADQRLQQLLQPVPTPEQQQSTSSCSFTGLWVFKGLGLQCSFLPKLAFAVLHHHAALAPPPPLPWTCLLRAFTTLYLFHGAHIVAVGSGPAAAVCHCTLRATMHQDVATHSKSHC